MTMRWLRRKRREATPEWLDVDGYSILVQGDVAFVCGPGSNVPQAIHIPTAAIAFARPLVGRA